MEKQVLMAKDIAEICNVSEGTGYKIIKQLNEELKAKGFLVFRGRVSKAYFMEKMYGMKDKQEEFVNG